MGYLDREDWFKLVYKSLTMAMKKSDSKHSAAHLNGQNILVLLDTRPHLWCYTSTISHICTHIWALASSGLQFPLFAFASHLHYSCTYWFVKQPIKLDMEDGMFTWKHIIPSDFNFPFFQHQRRDISSGFPKQEPVDTCVTSEKNVIVTETEFMVVFVPCGLHFHTKV